MQNLLNMAVQYYLWLSNILRKAVYAYFRIAWHYGV
jgi:hypothetical protein